MEQLVYRILQVLIIGVSLGSLYALIALGYTMVYGILKLINFAHGDVYMVGAYMGFLISTTLRLPPGFQFLNFVISLVLAMACCALYGVIIEKVAYKPLRQAPRIYLLSSGIGLFFGYLLAVILHLPISPMLVMAGLAGLAIGYAVFRVSQDAWRLGASAVIGCVVGALMALLWGLNPFTVIPLAAAVGAGYSWWMLLLHRRAFRPAPRISALITAIGVSLFLEYFVMRLMTPQQQHYPELIANSYLFFAGGSLYVQTKHILFLAVSLGLMVLLQYLVNRTRVGRAMRAVSFDREAAELMGVNVNSIISFTFAIGSALAAAAGVLFGTFYPIDPLMGLMFGIKSFVAAVLGGIGMIPGAVLGGLIMGVAEESVSSFLNSMLRDAVAFAVLIVILLFKPSGLFGRNVGEKV